jgi:Cof subfamily protein (haloacid dehalogenase superfamily)
MRFWPDFRRLERRLRRIELVACDLDGTLLDRQGRIPPDVRDSLAALRGQGVQVVLASGRSPAFTQGYADEAYSTLPPVSLNGALVRDRAGTVLHAPLLPAGVNDAWTSLPSELRERIALTLYTTSGVVHTGAAPVLPGYLDTSDADLHRVGSIEPYLPDAVMACVAGRAADLQRVSVALARGLHGRLERSLYPGSRGEDTHFIEIRRRHVSKGSALRALARRIGIPPVRVAAIGDYTNDIEMCTFAGVSAAMGNAVDELKRVADLVTRDDCDDGGAAEFFQTILHQRSS